MSATTLRKHAAARKPRRSLAAILLRRTAPEAAAPEVPRGEHPYPAGSPGLSPGTAIAVPPEVLAAVRDGSIGTAPRHAAPEAQQHGFAGASLAGLPDDTGTLAAIREDAVPGTVRILQRTRDGIRDLDKPQPLAFIRRAEPDGGFGQYWALDGEPSFLGLARAGDRQVAQARLGCLPDGSPWIFAGDIREIDARIAVLMVARDRLAYGSAPEPADQAADDSRDDSSEMDSPDPGAEVAETAVLIEQGWAVLRRSREVPWPDDATAGAQDGLRDALQRFGALLNGLVPGNPDPDPAALAAAAWVVRVRCGDLADLAGETSGDAVPETEEAADGAA